MSAYGGSATRSTVSGRMLPKQQRGLLQLAHGDSEVDVTGVNAIIQARMGSHRLPGKVLLPLGARPVLAWVVRAAQLSGVAEQVVVATSVDGGDDPVAELGAELGIPVVRG